MVARVRIAPLAPEPPVFQPTAVTIPQLNGDPPALLLQDAKAASKQACVVRPSIIRCVTIDVRMWLPAGARLESVRGQEGANVAMAQSNRYGVLPSRS